MPILPIEDDNEKDFDFEKGRSIIAEGAQLYVKTSGGNNTLVQLKSPAFLKWHDA